MDQILNGIGLYLIEFWRDRKLLFRTLDRYQNYMKYNTYTCWIFGNHYLCVTLAIHRIWYIYHGHKCGKKIYHHEMKIGVLLKRHVNFSLWHDGFAMCHTCMCTVCAIH